MRSRREGWILLDGFWRGGRGCKDGEKAGLPVKDWGRMVEL